MKKYILKRTFVTHDGSVYPARQKPYEERELPALALTPAFAELVDDGTTSPEAPKPVERNMEEVHYNGLDNKNVLEQHFQPSYAVAPTIEEAQPVIDISHLNSPDHVVAPPVLGQATASEIAALPYVSRKTAEKLVQALADGQVFTSYEDLDKAFKLGFGRTWKEVGLILPDIKEV